MLQVIRTNLIARVWVGGCFVYVCTKQQWDTTLSLPVAISHMSILSLFRFFCRLFPRGGLGFVNLKPDDGRLCGRCWQHLQQLLTAFL